MHIPTKKQFAISSIVAVVVIATIVAITYVDFNKRGISINLNTGHYGQFIKYGDNNYLSTHDVNVKKIIRTYFTNPFGITNPTEAQKYGYTLIYYYNKSAFIMANLYYWENIHNIASFAMYSMKTGKQISNCTIYSEAGLYKKGNLLLSVSSTGSTTSVKTGICFYERGAPNFTFIDLSPRLSKTETFFSDATGHTLKAVTKNVDTKNKTLDVNVYDTTKKDASGNFAFKRTMKVSY
ncbi:MAG TPA: hypothetical protein ENJ75_01340 [Candidatus Kaiserbacteria bacterium]|nr:hypothetical protein [Candidatus Kaiserbacteria bacterium]